MNFESLGINIAFFRNELDMTQERLAELAQVSTVFISQIETGIRKPSLKTVYSIACTLGVSIDTLINRNVSEPENNRYANIIFLLKSKTDTEVKFIEEVCRVICLNTKENIIIPKL